MFNALFLLFKTGYGIGHMSEILQSITDILEHFEADYLKDKDAKNAAIDAVIEILQEHKDK